MTFQKKLDAIVKKNNSLLCIGLDPEIEKLPSHLKKQENNIYKFNKSIIDATHDLINTYKPNIAFYEALGEFGLEQLKQTIKYIQKKYPEIPIILDAKRADIGNTSKMYAKAVFDYWRADAVTIFPYLGLDAVRPFLEYKDKLIILLIKTSNPDSKIFQDLQTNKGKLYITMAKEIAKWPYENIGIFVGATYPKELKEIRTILPNKIFLSAGLGAQRGEIEKAVKAGIDKKNKGIMFNASRSILYASNGKDFAQAARIETQKLRDTINLYR